MVDRYYRNEPYTFSLNGETDFFSFFEDDDDDDDDDGRQRVGEKKKKSCAGEEEEAPPMPLDEEAAAGGDGTKAGCSASNSSDGDTSSAVETKESEGGDSCSYSYSSDYTSEDEEDGDSSIPGRQVPQHSPRDDGDEGVNQALKAWDRAGDAACKRKTTKMRIGAETCSPPMSSSPSSSSYSPSPSSSSGSEITDVSSLGTPPDGGDSSPRVSTRKYGRGRPSSREDCGDINMKVLLQAVNELDRDQQRSHNFPRRVAFSPPSLRNGARSNFSFTLDNAKLIERENRRLLSEILKLSQKPRKRTLNPPVNPRTRPASSAINRQKDQRRIEAENQAFLKRLEAVKPTKGMSKTEQLMDYYGDIFSPKRRPCGYRSKTSLGTSSSFGSETVSLASSSKRSWLRKTKSRPEWNSKW